MISFGLSERDLTTSPAPADQLGGIALSTAEASSTCDGAASKVLPTYAVKLQNHLGSAVRVRSRNGIDGRGRGAGARLGCHHRYGRRDRSRSTDRSNLSLTPASTSASGMNNLDIGITNTGSVDGAGAVR